MLILPRLRSPGALRPPLRMLRLTDALEPGVQLHKVVRNEGPAHGCETVRVVLLDPFETLP